MKRGRQLIDLVGKRFGNLLVLQRVHKNLGYRSVYWLCECDCGNVKSIRSDCLRKRGFTHCGCKNDRVHIGDTFNHFTVIAKIGMRYDIKSNACYWKCQCSCGNISPVSTTSLRGGVKSCGCLAHSFDKHTNPHRVGNIPPWFFNQIKRDALSRNHVFNIVPEDIWELWLKQDGKCALSMTTLTLPKQMRLQAQASASLDRIDSSIGYEKDNIQWVHKEVNLMKGRLSTEKLIEWCKLIYIGQNQEE